MISFKDLVFDCIPENTLLFLTHTTTVKNLTDIIKDRKISKKFCKEFNEDLIYLFYGRADYNPDILKGNHAIESQMPITLLIKCNTFSTFYRVAPFDTGAFLNNVFESVFGEFRKIYDDDKKEMLNEAMENFNKKYSLYTSVDTPSKFVKLFYSTNNNFLDGKFNPSIPIDHCLEATDYKALAEDKTNNKYDCRNTSIEIQVNTDIFFDSNNVELIILPKDSVNKFKDDLNSLNIKFETYPPGPISSNIERMGRIRTILYQYYEKNGIIE